MDQSTRSPEPATTCYHLLAQLTIAPNGAVTCQKCGMRIAPKTAEWVRCTLGWKSGKRIGRAPAAAAVAAPGPAPVNGAVALPGVDDD